MDCEETIDWKIEVEDHNVIEQYIYKALLCCLYIYWIITFILKTNEIKQDPTYMIGYYSTNMILIMNHISYILQKHIN